MTLQALISVKQYLAQEFRQERLLLTHQTMMLLLIQIQLFCQHDVNVEDAVELTFNVQEFSALAAAAVPGVAILPGTLTGVVYDGEQAIQTFTSNRDGTLDFTAVGNPVKPSDNRDGRL